jgi:hypothetical protein
MDLPRRVVLITSGIISEPVQYRITRMNRKNHIPIETFDGSQFATLMNDMITMKDKILFSFSILISKKSTGSII